MTFDPVYERRLETFLNLLWNADPDILVYIYRLTEDGIEKPYLYRGQPFGDLQTYVQTEFGNGSYRALFRRGETMIFRFDFGLA